MWLEIVSHNELDTEVYDLRPADYTTTTTTTWWPDLDFLWSKNSNMNYIYLREYFYELRTLY